MCGNLVDVWSGEECLSDSFTALILGHWSKRLLRQKYVILHGDQFTWNLKNVLPREGAMRMGMLRVHRVSMIQSITFF